MAAAAGYGYLHTALNDHSRLAYTKILGDEHKETAAAFLARAAAWYAAAGITIERVLSDNGACTLGRTVDAEAARSRPGSGGVGRGASRLRNSPGFVARSRREPEYGGSRSWFPAILPGRPAGLVAFRTVVDFGGACSKHW
jgi:hypothetical protein